MAGNKKEYQSHLVDHYTKPVEKRRGIFSFFKRK